MNKLLFTTLIVLLSQVLRAQDVSLLTYNIKYDNPKDSINNWENRKTFLISQLRFYSPDIFGTQEALFHQLQDIQIALKQYQFFGLGREHGDEEGEHCAIFYNKNKVQLISQNTFWLSQTPNRPSKGWDAALNRICTYGVFQKKNSNDRFIVFNTHFDHVGKKARIESSKLILKKIQKINTQKLPIILMGDFNLEMNTEGIRIILKELQDTHLAAGKNAFGPVGTFNGFHFHKPVTRRIDYIFSGKDDFTILKSGILSDSKDCHYPSDHFPVYTELLFKNN
ncbi:endonuclease/exonuclease/phosphatase family protein [Aquimarina algiphila]|uniref:endonuclease/exonuclease/phosphatase family protein n=1 Tax=Aquimarina algiphila TaxID=2047982 RepID=UPI0023302884|nr:endonuclease/exonuclease/phosphatase family protein [Aquimarina algiphila]